MEIHNSIIDSDADPATIQRIVEANTTAVDMNNEAGMAKRQGRYNRATQLYREALKLKIAAFGDLSIQAALTYNAMGENYLKAASLDLAEESLRKALRIRDDTAFGGLGLGPRNDAAATRDNLGQLYEARGLFAEAREIRVKGAAKGETMCGNIDCFTPGGAMLTTSQLKTCGACRSVFYCSSQCQKGDWRSRHKVLCQAFVAAGANKQK